MILEISLDPVEVTNNVSDVEVSPSTVMQLNVELLFFNYRL